MCINTLAADAPVFYGVKIFIKCIFYSTQTEAKRDKIRQIKTKTKHTQLFKTTFFYFLL
jgi:hypothetical protein